MTDIGQVSIRVVPSAQNFVPDLLTQIRPGLRTASRDLANELASQIPSSLRRAITDGLKNPTTGTQGSKQGEQFGSAFERAVKTRLNAALSNLPNAKVGVDATEADARLAQLRRNIDTLSKTIGVHITDKAAAAAIDHVRTELLKLQHTDNTLSIRVNAGAASAELAALQAQLNKLSGSSAQEADTGSSGLALPNLMVAGILTALPLVGPLAGAASGALGGLAGAAGVAGLAIGGLNNEIQANSTLGRALTGQLDGLRASYSGLQATAAQGASGGVVSGLKQINAFLPTLNPLVGTLSHELGDAFSVSTGALITGLRTASPLLSDAGKYAGVFATDLEHAAESPRFAEFIAYSRRELPIVVHTLTDLATAGVHVFEALAPIGTVVLAGLNGLSIVLKDIPVPVLTALAVGATGVYVAFKGMAIIQAVNASLTAYAVKAQIAAGASEELAAANATASAGASGLAAKYGALGLAVGVAAGIVLINNKIADSLHAVPANADAASTALLGMGKSGQVSEGLLKSFGDSAGSLNSVLENGFKESTLTRIKDFTLPGIGTPFNSATSDAKNFFKSTDAGLSQLMSTGDKAAADNAFKILGNAAAAQGISVDQLLAKLPKYKEALDAFNAIPTGPIAGFNGVLMATSGSLANLADQYHITTAQALNYAAMTGIQADDVKQSTVSEHDLARALQVVTAAEATGSTATTEYLTALDAFSKSAGTAADRAAFIGATLKAANGDNLNYASTMNAAATANQTLVTALADGALKTVNWKTGLIDFNNAAAAPLIQGLDQLQTAAMNAAAATYQHELATKRGKVAADDAYTTYVSRTQGALIDEATHFGLTADQAKKFADQYFGLSNAPDIKKKIETIGTDPVQKILSSIESTLEIIAGLKPRPVVDVNTDPAMAHLKSFDLVLAQITTPRSVPITVTTSTGPNTGSRGGVPVITSLGSASPNTTGGGRPPGRAFGGGLPEGFSTINERGWELLHKSGATVQVYSHADSVRLLPQGPSVPAFADGTSGNPFTGINFASSSAGKSTAANNAAAKAAQALATAQANIRFTTSLDLSGLLKAATGSSATIAAAMRKLITDVHTAVGKQFGSSGLISTLQVENRQLQSLANERTTLTGRLKAADNLLAAERKLFSDERTKVASAVASNFDITSLNAPTVFGTASPAGFLQNLVVEEQQSQKFAAQLLALRKAGLDRNLIAQLGEAGVGQAGAAVQSLASFTPAQIKQANDLYAKANAAAQVAGTQVATSLYEAGVDSAQGYVNGLTSQLALVDSAAAKLANTVIKQIKKTLGIKSPSTVAHGLAGYTVAGYVAGVDDRLHLVRGAAARLANAAVTPAQFQPASSDSPIAGWGAPQIHVHPGPGMDEEAVGEAAARRLAARRL